MAHQRWSERARHHRRGTAGRLWLALVGALLLTACDSPAILTDNPLAHGGGGGGGGTGGSPSGLIGTWLNVTISTPPGDIQRQSTVWSFVADSSCARSDTSFSELEGILRVTDRRCTWSLTIDSVAVLYTDSLQPVVHFGYRFLDLAEDSLDLGDAAFGRVR